MTTKKLTIEQKYKSMTEVEHILQKSGMWIGSINKEDKNLYVYDNDNCKMIMKTVSYIPAVLKLVDEIISNSVDEYRRIDNLGLTNLDVKIDTNGFITIRDNGGIPVVKHKEAGIYVPTFLFGSLRTSSNYNDDDSRDGVGTNGVGSAITNVWSTQYEVNTADGKNSYHQTWSNNMNINDDLEIKKCTKKDHYTETKFKLDFKRLHETIDTCFSEDFINIIEKRCIDAAAANVGLNVHFSYTDNDKVIRESEWHFKTFDEYIELFTDYVDTEQMLKFSDSIMQVWVFPDNGINVGFVNGAECSRGTHIRAVRNEINNAISAYLLSKEKIDITPKNVDGKYSMFCTFHVNNPSYDSQTKECLTTVVEKFSNDSKYTFKVPDAFIKNVLKSEIVDIVIDWYKQKCEVEDQKTLRKLNRQAKTKIRNNDKFIDANSKRTADRELWIFEGDSARAGFRGARDPQTQAAYMLRGVILNVIGLPPTKIMANKELSDLFNIIGLQWGEPIDVKKLNFSKLIIATDADFDGSKIAGLLLTFFNLWPELFEAGIVCRSITHIITATKGNDVQGFFTMEDFKKKEDKLKGYKITYNKGLGGLTATEYKEMMRNPILHYYTKDDLADMTIKSWFGKGIAKTRKDMLKNEV